MSIKIAYTKFGTLMGDFTEKMSGGYIVDTPVMVNMGQGQVGLIPFLALTTASKVTLSEADINFGEIFEPTPEIRNHYSSQFGSGIVLR